MLQYRNTKFDEKACALMGFEEFDKMCRTIKTFKRLPEKERTKKIKELYGRLDRFSKKTPETGHSGDIKQFDSGTGKGNNRAKQRAVNGGEKYKKSEDKAEIQKRKVRKEKKKDES